LNDSKGRVIAGWVIAVLLAAGYGAAALGKLTGAQNAMFEGWGYAAWFAMLIGVVELLGAIGLLVPRTTRFAILGLTLVMAGAFYTHVANGEMAQIVRPGVFTALLWILWWLRGFGLSSGSDSGR
jgi:uncharacterized membrane protein YphA (DoxX/SURF4 family)